MNCRCNSDKQNLEGVVEKQQKGFRPEDKDVLKKDVQEKPGGNVSLRDAKELGCHVWGGIVGPDCIKLRGLEREVPCS